MKKKIKKLHRSNEGFTLIELVVTMMISSVVVAAVAGFLAMGLNYYRRTNAETALQTESQVAELFLTELLQESQSYVVYEAGDYPAGVSYAAEITRDGVAYIVARKGEVLVFGEVVDQAETDVTERIQSVSSKGLEEVFLARYVQNFTMSPTDRSVAVDTYNGLVRMELSFSVDGKVYSSLSTVTLRNTTRN